MKYVSEFRDPTLARHLAQKLADAAQPGRSYRFMEFCGGHTHAISRYGVSDLLPDIRLVPYFIFRQTHQFTATYFYDSSTRRKLLNQSLQIVAVTSSRCSQYRKWHTVT